MTVGLGGHLALPERHTLLSHYEAQINNGAQRFFMGRGDGVNGWRPLDNRVYVLDRLAIQGDVLTANATPDLEVTVYKNGTSDPGDVVFQITQDISSTGEFGIVEDTTAGSASATVTDSDFVIVRADLTTNDTASVRLRIQVEGHYIA